MPRSLTVMLLATLAATAIAACGGGSSSGETEIPGGADPAEVEVIDEWAHTLSRGDVDEAAEFFAIPSLAQNGPTLRIDSVEKARLFNSSLPCGASLVEATTDGEFTIATFRLTERPGAGVCNAEAEAEAQTAFRIEDGKIVEWRRVFAGGDGGSGAEEAPSSSA
jgi:limonene-1,2-epoxide hydrolase